MELLDNKEGNWVEDFSHENGNYMNICCVCQKEFLGHKRRVVCKKCATQTTIPDEPKQAKKEWDERIMGE